MSNRITPGSSLLETMRALAQGERSTAGAVGSLANATPNTETSRAKPASELRQRLRKLVATVNPDDRQATDQIREAALREIILWEFGSDFRQNAQFQPMIERINQAMDIDERFHAQFVEMIRGLK